MLYGIDAYKDYSARQAVDWKVLARETIYKDFAIVRLSESNAGPDKQAIAHIKGARDAGIPLVGGYMVPSMMPTAASAASEVALAQKMAAAAGGVDFMCIDFELPSVDVVIAKGLKAACVTKIEALIKAFEDARGETPVMYGYPGHLDFFGEDLIEASRCPLWIAHYKVAKAIYDPLTKSPTIPRPWRGRRSYAIWQYMAEGTGSLPGMDPKLPGVDRNLAPFDTVDGLREALGILVKTL